MKYDDFKIRIYNTNTQEYITNGDEFKALCEPKEYYNIELQSDLKTTDNNALYENDVIKLEFLNKDVILNSFFCIINLRQDKEWNVLVIARDKPMGIGLQCLKKMLEYPKECSKYNSYTISHIGVLHDYNTMKLIQEKEHRIFKEISKEFYSL